MDPSAIIGAGVAAVVASGVAGQAALPVAGALGLGGLGAVGGGAALMEMVQRTRCAPTQCSVSCSQRSYSCLTYSCSETGSLLPCAVQRGKMFLSTMLINRHQCIVHIIKMKYKLSIHLFGSDLLCMFCT